MATTTRDLKRTPAIRQGLPRGTSILECAMVLPVLFCVLFALLDLGLAATRYNALAEISRRIAREAVLHGSLAPETVGEWGTAEHNGHLADGTPYVAAAANLCPTMPPEDVSIRMSWPDADNSPRDRVQVEAHFEHQPLIPAICPWGQLDLRSVTTMHIVN